MPPSVRPAPGSRSSTSGSCRGRRSLLSCTAASLADHPGSPSCPCLRPSCGPGLAARSGPARRLFKKPTPLRVASPRLTHMAGAAVEAPLRGERAWTAMGRRRGLRPETAFAAWHRSRDHCPLTGEAGWARRDHLQTRHPRDTTGPGPPQVARAGPLQTTANKPTRAREPFVYGLDPGFDRVGDQQVVRLRVAGAGRPGPAHRLPDARSRETSWHPGSFTATSAARVRAECAQRCLAEFMRASPGVHPHRWPPMKPAP